MHNRHTGLNMLPKDNGKELFLEYLLAKQEQNNAFG
jgi:hypothetical protein